MKQALLFTIAVALCVNCFAQRKPVNKKDTSSGSQLVMSIEHNGEKKEIKYSQFQTYDGNSLLNADGKFTLFYGASNAKDSESFAFQGWIPSAQSGIFQIGGDEAKAGFNVMTTAFPNISMLIAQSGKIEITAMPLYGGFVVGTFEGVCETVTNEGSVEKYAVSGSFKLVRR